jgi:hypothetical protein
MVLAAQQLYSDRRFRGGDGDESDAALAVR